MVCQNCGKNLATTHIKQIVNGELTECHLCASCAAQMGYGNIFGGFGLSMDNLIGSFLGDKVTRKEKEGDVQRCSCCGSSFEDIVSSGKVGCSECYSVFRDRLIPSIQRIHPRAQIKSRLEEARKALTQAIEKQEFERAAQLRDEIRNLESQVI